jgi:hypothetical protein
VGMQWIANEGKGNPGAAIDESRLAVAHQISS